MTVESLGSEQEMVEFLNLLGRIEASSEPADEAMKGVSNVRERANVRRNDMRKPPIPNGRQYLEFI